MVYFISFLEGIITFISPCLLPMLPIYLAYFAGSGHSNSRRTLSSALLFVLGFSLVFMGLGGLAGSIGAFLVRYQQVLNLVTGIVVILFGLHFLGFFQLSIFRGPKADIADKEMSPLSAFLFGIIFSIGWTPCVGAFLGSALMMASQQAHFLQGVLMLLCYSLGLGIPFILSALFIDQLKGTFQVIKKNYNLITKISGILLVLIGLLMATGMMGKLLNMLS